MSKSSTLNINYILTFPSATLVLATAETVTITTTITECAASCYSTVSVCPNTETYTEFPTYSPTSLFTPPTGAPSPTETYPTAPSSSVTWSATSSQESCTDSYGCSYPVPTPSSYTTEWSELPVTTSYEPSSPGEDTSSTRDSCWSSQDSLSGIYPSTSQSGSESTTGTYDIPIPSYSVPSDISYSTGTQPTDTEIFPTPSQPSSSSDTGYPIPSYESSVDATATSFTPTTFVTNTREQSSTEDTPPAYGTTSDGPPPYGDPPTYTQPPTYG